MYHQYQETNSEDMVTLMKIILDNDFDIVAESDTPIDALVKLIEKIEESE